MPKKSVSLVIPAHNSAGIIESSLKEYSKFLSFFGKYEIIVVCNASTDNTAELSRKFAKKNKKIKVIEIPERGKGNAVIVGFKKAKCDIIGFMDADNVFYLPSVKRLIELVIQDKCDAAIASKWRGTNFFKVKEPISRKMLAIGWNLLSLFLFGLKFEDTQAGCKFLKRKAFLAIQKKRNFICKGFDFDVELLFRLKRAGFRIKEEYVNIIKIEKFSTFRLRYVPGMFWRLLRLWNKRFLNEV